MPSLLTMMADTPPLMASKIVPAPGHFEHTTVTNQENAIGYVLVELWSKREHFCIDELLRILDLIRASSVKLCSPAALVDNLVVTMLFQNVNHGRIVHLLEERVEGVRSYRD